MNRTGRWLRIFFGCHGRPDRSFCFRGKQFPICARCTGILVGYLLGIALLFWARLAVGWCLLLAIPLLIDGLGQEKGKWHSTNPRRLATGLPFGIATVHIIAAIFVFFAWLTRWSWNFGVSLRK